MCNIFLNVIDPEGKSYFRIDVDQDTMMSTGKLEF